MPFSNSFYSSFSRRISLPWGNLSNVPVQFEQIDFDTKWGRILMSQRLGDCAIPVQLDVTCAVSTASVSFFITGLSF